MKKIQLALFASGSGTNAENIIKYFKDHAFIRVSGVLCNKAGAGVISRTEKLGIPVVVFSKVDFLKQGLIHQWLLSNEIHYLILAGFLWQVPEYLVQMYPKQILNIHPALLPAYGGKGMYGEHVHKAVLAAGEKESGITIHRVDEIYDHGEILFQARCPVLPDDTTESLAQRIHALEHQYYPVVIEKVIRDDSWD